MTVAAVGLDHLGSVTAACLATNSNDVWDVDVEAAKVDDIMADRSPAAKPGVGVRMAEALKHTCNTFHASKVSFANEDRGPLRLLGNTVNRRGV
jgi:UDP-glucose 6-dehydrogenase